MNPRSRAFAFVEVLICLALVAILAAILVPNFVRARSRSSTNPCKSNLKNIGTALEMYSTDFKGEYPPSLHPLTPNYLRVIPTCPNARKDTYSASYRSWKEPGVRCPVDHEYLSFDYEVCKERRLAVHQAMRNRDSDSDVTQQLTCPISKQAYHFKGWPSYRFCCQGGNHTQVDISADYPAYDAISGLQERP